MTSAPSAFFREAGAGPGVVCLHSNASSSSQWRELMEMLAPRFHVLAADSYGAGKSPAWPADRQVALADEAALLEPVFARAGEPFALVGHSYGAAVALVAALAQPRRVCGLALYEPTLFALVNAEPRKGPIAASVANIRGWAQALFGEPTPLTKTLPRVEVVAFDGLGHMGPVTHPERVNEAIARFLSDRSEAA